MARGVVSFVLTTDRQTLSRKPFDSSSSTHSQTMAVSTGETLQERTKGKDVRLSNIVAAKVCMCVCIVARKTNDLFQWKTNLLPMLQISKHLFVGCCGYSQDIVGSEGYGQVDANVGRGSVD